MRVLMIDTASQTPFYVYPLCRALAAAGCAVELVTAPFTYDELPPLDFPLPVHETFGRISRFGPLRRSGRLRQVARALEYPLDWALTLRRIRRTRPDVVHVQWAMLPLVDRPAFRAIRRAGTRLVYTVHDIRPHYGRWRRALLSPAGLYSLADALVVHTEGSRLALCAAAGLPPSRVHVMPQGNLAEWAGPPLARERARTSLALPAEAPLVLFFGGIKPYKRLDLLIEALPAVLADRPTARLLIAGHAAEPFARYQRAIDRLGLGDHVITRLGYVPERQVAHYFCAADLVALPYTEADFSGVLMAAYTYGRPVVATDTGGLRELVERDGTGYVVPPTDVRALSAAIVRLLAEPELAARMGERGRDIALTERTWAASARAMLRVYGQSRHGSYP